MQFNPQSYSDRFDLILSDIESGCSVAAIATLGGLLDAAATEPEATKACHKLLSSHPLHQVVQSSSMAKAVSMLGFVRAEAAREALTAQLIRSLSDNGKRFLHIDSASGLDDAQILERVESRGNGFDHIVAPSIADTHSDIELLRLVETLGDLLAPNGRLCLSAFAPNHLGLGWQTICLARKLHCHNEASFSRLAKAMGAKLSCFRDASGALVWADFKLIVSAENGGNHNGHCD